MSTWPSDPGLPDRLLPEPPRPVHDFSLMPMFPRDPVAVSLENFAAEQIRRNDAAIEKVCERMLTLTSDRGVLVSPQPDGTVVAELSDKVPFGNIYWMPLWPTETL